MNAQENKMQASIVLHHHNGNYRSTLFASLSELLATPIGGKLRAMGLIKSCPDLTLIHNKVFYGMELKCENTRHDKQHLIEQAQFMLRNYPFAWFITNERDFFVLVDKIEKGASLPPSNCNKVLEICERTKANSVKWDYELFKIF